MPKNRWSKREGERAKKISGVISHAFLDMDLNSLKEPKDFLAKMAIEANLTDSILQYNAQFDQVYTDVKQGLKGEETFAKLLYQLSTCALIDIASYHKLSLPKELDYQKDSLNAKKIDNPIFKKFIEASHASIAVSVFHNQHQVISLAHSSIDISTSFAIHSVGKVFTGALMLKMLQSGIIPESALNQAPQLDILILEKLPGSVRDRLNKCTLKDLMIHQSGLGDYLGDYIGTLKAELDLAKLESRKPKILEMNTPRDFLSFVEDKLHALDQVNSVSGEKEHYSNAGILLIGLVIECAYNQQSGITPLTYNEILRKFILVPATIRSFSTNNPGNGITNPSDLIAPHIVGSPAGGYWMNSEDLGRFGAWMIQESGNPVFMRLLKEHGVEFYDVKRNIISHSGAIPSSSAMLRCYISTGTTIAVLSDKPGLAFNIVPLIEDNVTFDERALASEPQSNTFLLSFSQKQVDSNVSEPVQSTQFDEKIGTSVSKKN